MDIQVFKLVDVIQGAPFSDYLDEEGRRVIGLRLGGQSQKVSEVTVNGYIAIDFSVVGANSILVVLPVQTVALGLRDLRFIVLSSERAEKVALAEILFGIGKVSTKISGTSLLIQRWLRFLLMTPGTDLEDPLAGVGLLELAGQSVGGELREVRTEIIRMHQECKKQILERQLRNRKRNRPATELLRDARLTGLRLADDGRIEFRTQLIDGTNRSVDTGVRI